MRTAYLILPILVCAAVTGPPARASEPACASAPSYYAPADLEQRRPLARPDREFAGLQKRARAGDLAAQRNLGSYYDTGYLVDRCSERAEYWYRKAALEGDPAARDWTARIDALERLREGPACAGNACPRAVPGSAGKVVLYSGRGGHFHTPLEINGRSTNGIVDTGATLVSMSASTARNLGVSTQNARRGRSMTANGPKDVLLVLLDSVRIGDLVVERVEASVSADQVEMPTLIGMSFLGRLNVVFNAGSMTIAAP